VDLKIANGDLLLEKGDLVLVTGRDAIAQHLSIRLRTFLGEWFLDRRVGMPYFEQILVKDPNLAAVKALYRRAILTTPGVTDLKRLELTADAVNRSLTVSFLAETKDGPVELEEEMVL
jgi:hypothetical protein